MCGARAVTSMSERSTSSAILGRFASIPSTQNSRKRAQASVRSRTECRKSKMMTGLKTFSSKLPCEPATAIAVSLPITWTATVVSGERGELVGRRGERQARQLAELACDRLAESHGGVEPGADRGAPDRERQ